MTEDTPGLRIAQRRGVPGLAAHLGDVYGIAATEITQLDLGVYRVDRAAAIAARARAAFS